MQNQDSRNKVSGVIVCGLVIWIFNCAVNVLIVSILDNPLMETCLSLTGRKFGPNTTLTSELRDYTKMYILRNNGFVHFWRKNPDHSVIELKKTPFNMTFCYRKWLKILNILNADTLITITLSSDPNLQILT